jgi:NIMA (never in mitosis gene a)-related kinase
MSPELFANQPYNHKSDIWALGCCVHEIASLKHAFSARNINALMYKVIQGKVPPIPLQYSDELVGLVQQMMARNAEERPNVHQILRMTFIRKHIKMFLERAAGRKK